MDDEHIHESHKISSKFFIGQARLTFRKRTHVPKVQVLVVSSMFSRKFCSLIRILHILLITKVVFSHLKLYCIR